MTLVAATLSQELLSVANEHVPNLRKVTSKDLHRILPHVEQVFLAVEVHEKAGAFTSWGCAEPCPSVL